MTFNFYPYIVTEIYLLCRAMNVEELEEILLTISYKEEDNQEALKAFETLYRNYSKILSSIVKVSLKNMGIYDEQLYKSIMNNVFHTIFEKPLSFTVPKNAKNDNCFKAWLSVIAKNEFKSLIKEYYGKEDSLNENEDYVSEVSESGINHLKSKNMKLMDEALNTLSERDKHIMTTLYNYHEEGRKTPSDVLDYLCKLHSTTKINIRKIKERSEKKIIEFFAKHTLLIPLKNDK